MPKIPDRLRRLARKVYITTDNPPWYWQPLGEPPDTEHIDEPHPTADRIEHSTKHQDETIPSDPFKTAWMTTQLAMKVAKPGGYRSAKRFLEMCQRYSIQVRGGLVRTRHLERYLDQKFGLTSE